MPLRLATGRHGRPRLCATVVLATTAVALWGAQSPGPASAATVPARTLAGLPSLPGVAYPDATTFQENPTRDGYAGPANLPASLTRAWSTQLPGRVSYPVIAGGRLFVSTAQTGSTASGVYAFDAVSGRPLWGPLVVPASDGFVQLTYDAGRLFAVTELGMVEALDPANGARLWSRTIGFGQQQELGPPLATHGHVIGSASSPWLWSFAESTGGVEVSTGLQSTATPAVSDGSTIFMAGGCRAGAISVSNVVRWQQTTCSGAFGPQTAVLHEGQLWSRQGPGLPGQIRSAVDGHQTGSFSSDYPPAFGGPTVLLLQGNRLVAADATTLVRRWTQKADGGLDTAPVIAGQVAYVGSKTGTVYGFSMATGAEVWRGTAGAPVVGGDVPTADYELIQNPTIGDGVLAVPAGLTLTVFAAPAAAGNKPPPYVGSPVPPVTINPGTTVYPDATAFQENAAHDGYAGPALPSNLHERWSHTFQGAEGSPLMVAGRMFVPVVENGALDVYAYRAGTGELLWGPVAVSAATGPPGQDTYGGGLAYDAGRLFALSGSGLLAALNPATGGRFWSTQLAGTYPLQGFSSGPVASAGLVYAVGEGDVSGIRESTGTVVFSRLVPGDWSIPAASSRGVFIGFVAFEAVALSPTGAVSWDTKVGSGGWGGAQVLHANQDWIRFGWNGEDGRVLDQATGRVVRTFSSSTPPAFAGTSVLLTQDGTLTGTDAATGAVLWSQAGDGYLDSPPVIAGSTAYVTSRLGNVFGFSTLTGGQVWQATLTGPLGYEDNSALASGFATGPMIGNGYLAVPNGHTLTVFGG